MAEQQNKDNSGVLFVNDRKQNSRQPDHSGRALIGGREYYVSGWLNDGRRGQYLKLAFTPRDDDSQTQGEDEAPF